MNYPTQKPMSSYHCPDALGGVFASQPKLACIQPLPGDWKQRLEFHRDMGQFLTHKRSQNRPEQRSHLVGCITHSVQL